MNKERLELLKSYLANTQLNLFTVSHTKVADTWRMYNIVPEINRLYYIREGEGWIKIKGREYYPKPGQMFLLPAGVEQSFSYINDNRFRKYWCHFTITVGDIHLFQLLPPPAYIEVKDHDKVEGQFQELMQLHESADQLTAPLRIKSIMYELISTFLESADALPGEEQQPSVPANVTKIDTILAHIDRHLAEQMTIEELAKLVHFHPNYFLHVFKSMLGVSPIVYINKKRMEKARHQLMTSEQPISEIAGELGMEPYYFSRTFKKLTGMSPSEYRQYGRQIPILKI